MALEVPVICLLGERTMSLGDVVGLLPGSIIELPKNADEELELLVNNKAVATGTAVKVGENFGIKVAFIGDVKSRIEAMGKKPEMTEEQLKAAKIAEQLLGAQM